MILHVYFLLFLSVHVILAVPDFTAVIFPLDTVATFGFDECHLDDAAPLSLIFWDCPLRRVKLFLDRKGD